jgi:hypothetical protein
MRRTLIALAAAAAATTWLPAPPAAAAPAGPNSGTLTVNTIFWDDPSPVVAATGVFAGCDAVTQEADGAKFTWGTAVFSGVKRVHCGDDHLDIAYTATLNKRLGGTHGSWRALEGTGALAGLSGGGRLTGSGDCEAPEESAGCILDTFTGVLA